MNRKLMLGIAAFLAIIGAAVIGMENEASAGRGCGGGLLARLHARKAACGGPADCGTPVPPPAPPACAGAAPDCAAEPSCGGGGFLSRLRAKHAARKAARKADCGKPADCGAPAPPAPCCEPAPAPAPAPCCAPAPAPAPCCEPAPAPAPTPCCAAAPVISEVVPPVSAPCCGMVSEPIISAAPMVESVPMASPCCGGGDIMMDTGVIYDSSPSDYYGGAVGGSIMVNEAGEEIVPGSVQVIDDGAGEASEVPEVAPEASEDGI